MNPKHLLALVFVLLLSACANPLPPSHPDFSGTWVLDKTNSKFQFPDPSTLEKALLVIEHREPNFKFSRTLTVAGNEGHFSYDLTTDGKESGQQGGGYGTYTHLTWEGDQLVFSARIVDRGGESNDTVHYSLLQGGRVPQMEETYRGTTNSWDNHWVLSKQ